MYASQVGDSVTVKPDPWDHAKAYSEQNLAFSSPVTSVDRMWYYSHLLLLICIQADGSRFGFIHSLHRTVTNNHDKEVIVDEAHLGWLEPAARSGVCEFANSRSLHLLSQCADVDLRSITSKIQLEVIPPDAPIPEDDPNRASDASDFFISSVSSYSPFHILYHSNSSFRHKKEDNLVFTKLPSNWMDDCIGCETIVQPGTACVEACPLNFFKTVDHQNITTSVFSFHGSQYHQHDFIHLKAPVEGLSQIARILGVDIKARTLQLRFYERRVLDVCSRYNIC